jgi:hypothetical protein
MSKFKEIFSNDIEITGSHSNKVNFLIGRSDEKLQIDIYGEKIDIKIFPTLADAFMVATVIGYVNSLKENADGKGDSSKIFAEKARKIAAILEEIYHVMIFTDDKFLKLEQREKFEQAFSAIKTDNKKDDKQIFDYFLSYTRGGVDYLYNKALKINTLTDLLKFYNNLISNYSEKSLDLTNTD